MSNDVWNIQPINSPGTGSPTDTPLRWVCNQISKALTAIQTQLNSAQSNGLISPLTTKGDVWGYSNANARVPIGSDGEVLTADSTQSLGLKWASGGSLTSPLTTKGDLWGYAATNARVPVGSDGQVLTARSSNANGVDWEAAPAASLTLTAVDGTPVNIVSGGGLGAFNPTLSLPANTFAAGQAYRLVCRGLYTSSNAPPGTTFNLILQIGSITLCTCAMGTSWASQTNRLFEIDALILVITAGVSGTIQAQGIGRMWVGSAGASAHEGDGPNGSDITIDTTQAYTVQAAYTATGAQTPTNAFTVKQIALYQV